MIHVKHWWICNYFYCCWFQSWCQILHVFTYFFMLCNYFWMFCEGLYLHTILLRVFSTGRKLIAACHVTGWGILRMVLWWDSQITFSIDRIHRYHSFVSWIYYKVNILSITGNIMRQFDKKSIIRISEWASWSMVIGRFINTCMFFYPSRNILICFLSMSWP